MKKRMNKRGQFYLLAAMIIITVIVGFAAVSNYAKKKGIIKVYDIKDELNIESGKVLEYGEFALTKGKTLEEIINDFIEKYYTYGGEGKDLIFVYGNSTKIYKIGLGEAGDIGIITGTRQTSVTIKEVHVKEMVPLRGPIIVKMNDNEYSFELKPGQNFFFIISQEVEGEKHIVTS